MINLENPLPDVREAVLGSLVAEANEEGTSRLPESGQFEFLLKDNGEANRASPAVRYQDKFFFVVSNGQGDEHLFQIVYGDGLTGIRDEFIPEF